MVTSWFKKEKERKKEKAELPLMYEWRSLRMKLK
jgi:hypothetical protein